MFFYGDLFRRFHILLSSQKQLLKLFYKKRVLKDFANFPGKHLCGSLFLIKLQVIRSATSLKRDPNKGAIL